MKPQVQRVLNYCGHLGRIWQFWQYSACTYESVTPQVSAWEKKAYLLPRKIKMRCFFKVITAASGCVAAPGKVGADSEIQAANKEDTTVANNGSRGHEGITSWWRHRAVCWDLNRENSCWAHLCHAKDLGLILHERLFSGHCVPLHSHQWRAKKASGTFRDLLICAWTYTVIF